MLFPLSRLDVGRFLFFQDQQFVSAPFQRDLDGVGQTNPNSFPHDQTIDYGFNRVPLAFF